MADHAILVAFLATFFLPAIVVLVACSIIDRIRTRRADRIRRDRIRRQVIGESLRR